MALMICIVSGVGARENRGRMEFGRRERNNTIFFGGSNTKKVRSKEEKGTGS